MRFYKMALIDLRMGNGPIVQCPVRYLQGVVDMGARAII